MHRAWSRFEGELSGQRAGDTWLVVFQVNGGSCHGQTLAATFVGAGKRARVRELYAACLAER